MHGVATKACRVGSYGAAHVSIRPSGWVHVPVDPQSRCSTQGGRTGGMVRSATAASSGLALPAMWGTEASSWDNGRVTAPPISRVSSSSVSVPASSVSASSSMLVFVVECLPQPRVTSEKFCESVAVPLLSAALAEAALVGEGHPGDGVGERSVPSGGPMGTVSRARAMPTHQVLPHHVVPAPSQPHTGLHGPCRCRSRH